MKVTREELLELKNKTLQQLQNLENQYVGGNDIQQDILKRLQQINLSYQWDKDIFEARIAYIDTLLSKIKDAPYCTHVDY